MNVGFFGIPNTAVAYKQVLFNPIYDMLVQGTGPNSHCWNLAVDDRLVDFSLSCVL